MHDTKVLGPSIPLSHADMYVNTGIACLHFTYCNNRGRQIQIGPLASPCSPHRESHNDVHMRFTKLHAINLTYILEFGKTTVEEIVASERQWRCFAHLVGCVHTVLAVVLEREA